MRRLFSVAIILCCAFSTKAQTISCGCDSAKDIKTNTYGPVRVEGKPNAFLSMPHTKGWYFEKPHSVAWFTFVVPEDTLLTFDIIPANNSDDLDFLLFKGEEGFCKKINQQRLKPVRANIANTSQTKNGATGLSADALNETELPGKHPAYSKTLQVKKGERFYLAVDNYTDSLNAFTLYLHLRRSAIVVTPPPVKKPDLVALSNDAVLKIVLCDSTKKPVAGRLKILSSYWRMNNDNGDEEYGLGSAKLHRTSIDTSNVSMLSVKSQQKQKIKITAIASGFLLNQDLITIPDNVTEFSDTIWMNPIRKNGNMVLQDIKFEPDQPAFLPASKEPLSNLLLFMQSNPTVKILIKGYVNDPQGTNEGKFDQDLSENRAKAVYSYLMNHGIDKERMDWVGFGARDMLFPNARTWEEQEANRRVEIEIK
jgi:outer membrane protein OmpA-like peptidoglycan-associated protein